MLAVIGCILAILAWFEHGTQAGRMSPWIDTTALLCLAVAFVAAHLFWPLWRGPRPPVA